MKTYFKTLLLMSVTFFPALAQTTGKDHLAVSLSNPDQPGSIEIDLVCGGITVVGYSGKEIIIDAQYNIVNSTQAPNRHPAEIKRVQKGNPSGLSAEEENNRITLNTNSRLIPVYLIIKVPLLTSLKLRTYDKGDIKVENVNGNIEADNVNGAITLVNIGGSAFVNTYNGEIKASLQINSFNRDMAFSSMGGRIDISYPQSLTANMKVKSEQGEIFSDLALISSQTKIVSTDKVGRNLSVLDDWLYGEINGGGAQIMVSNYLGDIYLKKFSGDFGLDK